MKSFLSDRARIDSPSTPAAAAGPAAAPGTPFASSGTHIKGKIPTGHAENPGAPAQIECVREGDRITRLIVVCACGERIEIDCLYAFGK